MVVSDPASEATIAAFCKAFREARLASGLTQEQVATASRHSGNYISDIENGRSKNMTLRTMMTLAKAVGMTLDVNIKAAPPPRKST